MEKSVPEDYPRPVENDVTVENNSSFILRRTRVILDYERSGLQAHAVIQNKSVWGSKGNQALNLYEGWVKMSASNGLFAQIGRIALAYDDERIIGTNDFATASLSHDVLRVGYEGHGHTLHAIFGYNQNVERAYANTYYVDGAQYYKTMQTVWYHYDVPTFPLGVSLLFMNMGVQAGKEGDKDIPPSVQYQQMWGGYFNYHPKYLTLEGTYYRQTGQQVNIFMQHGPIRAWMASGKATYHYLATATQLQNFNCTLGHSIELEASYQFTKDISLIASYTYMKGTDTMSCLKKKDSGKHAHWGWFSLAISPTLFTSKW